ncbi:hypothetical protein [Dyadobacter sp. MSC1_007]|jgi:hypothetical protein|uniref:hypothetical protein n=1 Tax=Dyadobacter sp. MSC1_007 TaxID=2909264 RepID=UPI0020307CF8|nr:hypothetical protein [Dyadobacter sp. MSC1_007]
MRTNRLLSRAFYTAAFGTAMLLASTAGFAQVKIGSNPTTIDPNNNLEVESTDPTKKISIHKTTGKLTIADGSQGDKKVLTSDANGVATWQSQSELSVPVTAFSGAIVGQAIVPTFTTHDEINQRLPLVPTLGAAGWNATEKRYVVPADGTYSVQVGLSCVSTTGAGVTLWTRIWVTSEDGGPLFKGTSPLGAGAGDWQSVVYTGKLTAGAGISLEGYTMQTDGNPPINPIWTGTCGRAYMTVTKID